MAFPKGKPRPPGAGRKPGSKNKRTLEAEEAARVIVDDPKVQEMWLKQARKGELPPGTLQTLMYYAWGRPVEKLEHSGNADKPLILSVRRADGN